MNKKIFFGSGLVALVGVVGLTMSVSAYRGNPNVQGPNYSAERHEAMQEAFASGDYNAWKELMGNRGITRVINAENFSKFVEMRQAMIDGDTEKAQQLREELGIPGQGKGMMGGKCNCQ